MFFRTDYDVGCGFLILCFSSFCRGEIAKAYSYIDIAWRIVNRLPNKQNTNLYKRAVMINAMHGSTYDECIKYFKAMLAGEYTEYDELISAVGVAWTEMRVCTFI